MGACVGYVTDPFKKLVKQYGEDFVKKVTIQKGKKVINEAFQDFYKKANQHFDKYIKKIDQKGDQKIANLKQKYEKVRSKIDSIFPGGIAKLQQKKGKTFEEMTGLPKLQGLIDRVRDKTIQQINEKRQQAMNKIKEKHQQLIAKISAQQPQIPLYDNLSDGIKESVQRKGQEQFKEQVEAKIGQYKKMAMDEQNGLELFQQVWTNINPDLEMDGIVQNSSKDFMKNIGQDTFGSFGGLAKFF